MGGFFKNSYWEAPVDTRQRLPRCGECKLHKQCFSPKMKPTGEGKKSILFVAEAPGENEDRQGVQLVGDAGKLLRNALRSIGEDLDDCVKTNCVICRLPKNKMEDKYIEACRPTLLRTIEEMKPTVIFLLGTSAVTSLIKTEWKKRLEGIDRWAGWNISSATYNAWICPTYHPSYILRMREDPTLMLLFKKHLKKGFELAKRIPDIESIQDLKSQVDIIKTSLSARCRIRALSQKEGILAFDYETTGIKPDDPKHRIVSCSFCLNGEDTFACKVDRKTMLVISKVLKNPRLLKVASNLKFEERWTLAKLGHPVASWHWDTMLAAHIMDNRSKITSLKFMAYVLLGIGDYDSHISPMLKSVGKTGFNSIDEIDTYELLLYNGLDSLLEYKIMEKQKSIMGWEDE